MLRGCEFGTDPCKSSPDGCSPNSFAHPSPEQPPDSPHRTLSASGVCTPGRGLGQGTGLGVLLEAPRCPQSAAGAPGPNRAWEGGGGGGTAGYGSAHSPTVPRGDRTRVCMHPRSTHGCLYPQRSQRTCVCTHPHEAPKAPMGARTPGCPSPQEGGNQGAPPGAPSPPQCSAGFRPCRCAGGGSEQRWGAGDRGRWGLPGCACHPPRVPCQLCLHSPSPAARGREDPCLGKSHGGVPGWGRAQVQVPEPLDGSSLWSPSPLSPARLGPGVGGGRGKGLGLCKNFCGFEREQEKRQERHLRGAAAPVCPSSFLLFCFVLF